MSLIKRYSEDAADVIGLAALVATIPDDTERFTALRSVFDHCGHLAGQYADPATVVRMLVSETTQSYHTRLKAGRLAAVGL